MRRSRLVRQRRIWYSGGPHFGNSLPMISCLKQWMGFASVFALRATPRHADARRQKIVTDTRSQGTSYRLVLDVNSLIEKEASLCPKNINN